MDTAVVLATYNRVSSLKRLVGSLLRANYPSSDNISLIISIDYSGENTVYEYAKTIEWPYGPKKIRTFSKNQGLKEHILQCGDYSKDYDFIIVLEDDLYVSESYYYYTREAVRFYEDEERISGISLYGHHLHWINKNYHFHPEQTSSDVYFMKLAKSWGQAWTWKQWNNFREWYSENPKIDDDPKLPQPIKEWPSSSWLKHFHYYCISENKYFVYPYSSLTTNFTEPGTHNDIQLNDYQVQLQGYKTKFNMCRFNDPNAVVYDEFMERERIGPILGISEDNLCVDLYGLKNEFHYKEYLLTSKHLNLKPHKTYGLYLRPIEKSVLEQIEGEDLYLYKFSKSVTLEDNIKISKLKDSEYLLLRYFWKVSSAKKSLFYVFNLIKTKITTKINSLFNKS